MDFEEPKRTSTKPSKKSKKPQASFVRVTKANRSKLKSDRSERSYLSQSHIATAGYKKKIKKLLNNNKSLAKALENSQLTVADLQKQVMDQQKLINYHAVVYKKLHETSTHFSKATTSLVEALSFCDVDRSNELTLTLTGHITVPESDLRVQKSQPPTMMENCQPLNFERPIYMPDKMSKVPDMSLIEEVSTLEDSRLPPIRFTEDEETEICQRTTSTRSRRAMGSQNNSSEPRVTGRELRSRTRSKSSDATRRKTNTFKSPASPETPKTPPRFVLSKSSIPKLISTDKTQDAAKLVPSLEFAEAESEKAKTVVSAKKIVHAEVKNIHSGSSVKKTNEIGFKTLLPIANQKLVLPLLTKVNAISSNAKTKMLKGNSKENSSKMCNKLAEKNDVSKISRSTEFAKGNVRRETFVVPKEPSASQMTTVDALKRRTYFVPFADIEKNAPGPDDTNLKRQTYFVIPEKVAEKSVENVRCIEAVVLEATNSLESKVAPVTINKLHEIKHLEGQKDVPVKNNQECEKPEFLQNLEPVITEVANVTNYTAIDMSLTDLLPPPEVLEKFIYQGNSLNLTLKEIEETADPEATPVTETSNQKQEADTESPKSAYKMTTPINPKITSEIIDSRPPHTSSAITKRQTEKIDNDNSEQVIKLPQPADSEVVPGKETSVPVSDSLKSTSNAKTSDTNIANSRPSRQRAMKSINYKEMTLSILDSDSDFQPSSSPAKKQKTVRKSKMSVKKLSYKVKTPNSDVVSKRNTFLTLKPSGKIFDFTSDSTDDSDDDGFIGKRLKIKPWPESVLREKNRLAALDRAQRQIFKEGIVANDIKVSDCGRKKDNMKSDVNPKISYVKRHKDIENAERCKETESRDKILEKTGNNTLSSEKTSMNKQPESGLSNPESIDREPSNTTKEPCNTTKEPCNTTKEPCNTTKEPSNTTKEPSTSTKEPSTSTKEPSTSTKEPSTSTKEPSTSTKEPSTSTKEPSTSTKEPAKSTKKPSGMEKVSKKRKHTYENYEPNDVAQSTEKVSDGKDLIVAEKHKQAKSTHKHKRQESRKNKITKDCKDDHCRKVQSKTAALDTDVAPLSTDTHSSGTNFNFKQQIVEKVKESSGKKKAAGRPRLDEESHSKNKISKHQKSDFNMASVSSALSNNDIPTDAPVPSLSVEQDGNAETCRETSSRPSRTRPVSYKEMGIRKKLRRP